MNLSKLIVIIAASLVTYFFFLTTLTVKLNVIVDAIQSIFNEYLINLQDSVNTNTKYSVFTSGFWVSLFIIFVTGIFTFCIYKSVGLSYDTMNLKFEALKEHMISGNTNSTANLESAKTLNQSVNHLIQGNKIINEAVENLPKNLEIINTNVKDNTQAVLDCLKDINHNVQKIVPNERAIAHDIVNQNTGNFDFLRNTLNRDPDATPGDVRNTSLYNKYMKKN